MSTDSRWRRRDDSRTEEYPGWVTVQASDRSTQALPLGGPRPPRPAPPREPGSARPRLGQTGSRHRRDRRIETRQGESESSGPPGYRGPEQGPSEMVGRFLFSSELFCGEWRRHWSRLGPKVAVAVLATMLLAILLVELPTTLPLLAFVLLVLWLLALGWVCFAVIDWRHDRFVLTDQRVLVVSGIFTRRVAMMPLRRVTDLAYEQSVTGRLLHYGTFVLESAGQDQALRQVDYLPDPNLLYLQICEQMYAPRRQGAPAQQHD